MFELRRNGEGDVTLVGRLDAVAAEEAAGDFAGLSGSTVLDCSGLEYVSSAGISVIMMTYKRLHGGGHTLRMAKLQPRVRNVFVCSGLHTLLGIE